MTCEPKTAHSVVLFISADDRPLHTAKCCNQYVLRVCFHQVLKFPKKDRLLTYIFHAFTHTTQRLQHQHRARKLRTISSRQFARIQSKSSILKSFITIAAIFQCMVLDKLHFITSNTSYLLQATIQSWRTVLQIYLSFDLPWTSLTF